MADEPVVLRSVEVQSPPDETWAMTSNYGVSAGVSVGVDVYEGDIAVLYVKGKRGGKTNTLRTSVDVVDRLCAEWIKAQSLDRK